MVSLNTRERYNPAGNYLLKVNNTLILHHICHTYICKLLSLFCPVAGHELCFQSFSVVICKSRCKHAFCVAQKLKGYEEKPVTLLTSSQRAGEL